MVPAWLQRISTLIWTKVTTSGTHLRISIAFGASFVVILDLARALQIPNADPGKGIDFRFFACDEMKDVRDRVDLFLMFLSLILRLYWNGFFLNDTEMAGFREGCLCKAVASHTDRL